MTDTSTVTLPDGRTLHIACRDGAGTPTGRFGTDAENPGVTTVTLSASEATSATVTAWLPLDGEVTWWTPSGGRGLGPDWGHGSVARSVRSAPAGALLGPAGDATSVVVAASVNVRVCELDGGVREEDGTFRFRLAVQEVAVEDGTDVVVRFDVTGRSLAVAMASVTRWWQDQLDGSGEALAERAIPPVPDAGREAVFSTWYAEHQSITAASVEAQARLAAEIGLTGIIVDDGWQTTDRNRGFAHCGDWEPNPDTFPDMAAHVAAVQAAGLKYLLWFGAPLIGRDSAAWNELDGKLLGYSDGLLAGIADPRFPEVRALLVGRIARAVREWGVDGLKIDFVDSWASFDVPERAEDADDGRDCSSVDLGAERFLDELAATVEDVRPDVLIEFRQSYIGPRLWRYTTLLRAGDCPADAVQNRQATLDVRVLAGDRAVHADMLMWHPNATPATAAAQLTAILFAVPQISVRLDTISPVHRSVLTFWLGVADRWRAVLQHGELTTTGSAQRFTQASATDEATRFVAAYADGLVEIEVDDTPEVVLVNARGTVGLAVRGVTAGPARLEVFDCTGAVVGDAVIDVPADTWWVPVPSQGLAVVTREPV